MSRERLSEIIRVAARGWEHVHDRELQWMAEELDRLMDAGKEAPMWGKRIQDTLDRIEANQQKEMTIMTNVDHNLDNIEADLPTLISEGQQAAQLLQTLSTKLSQTNPTDPRSAVLDGQIKTASAALATVLAAIGNTAQTAGATTVAVPAGTTPSTTSDGTAASAGGTPTPADPTGGAATQNPADPTGGAASQTSGTGTS